MAGSSRLRLERGSQTATVERPLVQRGGASHFIESETAAVAEKAFAAERRLVWLRLAVVTCNVVLYFAFLRRHLEGTHPALAIVVTVLAFAYSLYVLFAEPYRRFPILTTG